MTSIFTKIIAGELPSYKIYEDEMVYAFLDIKPLQDGHVLLIPKIEIDHIIDLPGEHYHALWKAAQHIGHAVQKAMNSKRVSFLTLGFEVAHAHLHIIPINAESDIRSENAHTLSEEALKHIQAKIVAFL